MTDLEQIAQANNLARRIARSKAWIQDGVACRDPLTDKQWRWFRDHWEGTRNANNPFDDFESQNRAQANGPDWRDAATLGVLLGLGGTLRVVHDDEGQPFLFCALNAIGTTEFNSLRAKAILEAYCHEKGL